MTLLSHHYIHNFFFIYILSLEPKFVGSYMIPDNEDRDDNKMYFFFTEKALEAENSAHTIYARVGRLCVVRMACLCLYPCPLHSGLCYTVLHVFLIGSFQSFWQHALIIFISLDSSTIYTSSLPIWRCVL